MVRNGLTSSGVTWALTAGEASNWHPVTWWSHMLDVQLFGVNAGAHHSVNLALHIVNALLLLWLLTVMTGALYRSAFVAALFALHPLHVESVAWISERKDVLSTLLLLLTMWAYVHYTRQTTWRRYFVITIAFALGLMAKPMLVTLPFVLLLLDYWPLGRMRMGRATVLPLVREKAALFVLAAASSVITVIAQSSSGAVSSLKGLPFAERIANALSAYVTYMAKTLWPTDLAVLYPLSRHPSVISVIGSAVLLLGLSALIVALAARYPYLAVGWFWFLGTLVPVIGLIQVGVQAVADRYTYVPAIGLFIAISWGATDLLQSVLGKKRRHPEQAQDLHSNTLKVALSVMAIAIIACCAVAARKQTHYWESNYALWNHTLAVTTENYMAELYYGIALKEQANTDEAIRHFEESIRIRPDFEYGHFNLGLTLMETGKPDKAVEHFNAALPSLKNNPIVRHSMGLALAAVGRLDESVGHYQEAVRLDPRFFEAYTNLGVALARQERYDQAIAALSQAVAINPRFAEAQSNLGATYGRQGNIEKAVAHLTDAVRLNPARTDSRNNLASALRLQGKSDGDIQRYMQELESGAVRNKP